MLICGHYIKYISGLVFTNPDMPALKYGRVIEDDAANCFTEIMKKKQNNFQLHECGIYLHNKVPYIGGSHDRIVTCSCCKPACLEIKCPYSINHLSPHDPEAKVTYLVKKNDEIKLRKTHRYYSICLAQMAVTEL